MKAYKVKNRQVVEVECKMLETRLGDLKQKLPTIA